MPPPIRRTARRLAHAAFAAIGLEVRRRAPPPVLRAATPESELAAVLARLGRLGVDPGTVFDIGVANGTPDLYAAFPRACHVLVEPLAEFRSSLEAIAARYRVIPVHAAAGRRAGVRTLHVHDDLLGSSLLAEVEGGGVDGVPREVEVVTLDSLLERHPGLAEPFVLKIDVQGAELEVLEGGARVLERSEVVLLEASLFRFFTGGPILHEVVAWMAARGFVAWDTWGRLERPLDGALAQIDLAFVREGGPLRASHSFAAPGTRDR